MEELKKINNIEVNNKLVTACVLFPCFSCIDVLCVDTNSDFL
jgi:hypothetical protein